jgi:uncharacterized membrane protein
MPFIPLSRPSRRAAAATGLMLLGTTAFLVVRYPTVPDLLPVHFNVYGFPDGWQYRTPGRVLMPVFVQLTLALSLGSIAGLLLSRGRDTLDRDAPDVRAASAAAETVLLITAIWVTFHAYGAVALLRMWTAGREGLGILYTVLEATCAAITVAVAVRGHARIGRPIPRPFVAAHWRFAELYTNPEDPALFVPTRDGRKWTLNFGRPVAAALLGVVLMLGVAGPTVILMLALRGNF